MDFWVTEKRSYFCMVRFRNRDEMWKCIRGVKERRLCRSPASPARLLWMAPSRPQAERRRAGRLAAVVRAIQAHDSVLEVEASYKRWVVYVGADLVAEIDVEGKFVPPDAWGRVLPRLAVDAVEAELEAPRL